MTALDMIEKWNKRDELLARRNRHSRFSTLTRDEIMAIIAGRRDEAEKQLDIRERVRALTYLANWRAPVD